MSEASVRGWEITERNLIRPQKEGSQQTELRSPKGRLGGKSSEEADESFLKDGVFAKPQVLLSDQRSPIQALVLLSFTHSLFFPLTFFHLVNILEHFPCVKGTLISRSRLVPVCRMVSHR